MRFNAKKRYQSFILIPTPILNHPKLSDGAKLCWARLTKLQSDNGAYHINYEELSSESNKSETQIKHYVQELVDQGLVEETHSCLYLLEHSILQDPIPMTDKSVSHNRSKTTHLSQNNQDISVGADNINNKKNYNNYNKKNNKIYSLLSSTSYSIKNTSYSLNNTQHSSDRISLSETERTNSGGKRRQRILTKSERLKQSSKQKLLAPKKREPIKLPKNIPIYVNKLLALYESYPGIPKARRNTKYFAKLVDNCRKIVNGKLLSRKYTVEEIETAIERHHLALSPEYEPADKKYLYMHFGDFLINPFRKNIISYVEQWSEFSPKPMIQLLSDPNPDITQIFLNYFHNIKLSNEKMNRLIKGSQKAKGFFDSFGNSFSISGHSPEQIGLFVIEAIEAAISSFDNKSIQIGHFSSEHLYVWLHQHSNSSGPKYKSLAESIERR